LARIDILGYHRAHMHPVILHVGPLTIYSYGLMMAIAFLVGGWLTGRELTRKGFNGELASSLVLWAAVGGLVGARFLALLGDPAEVMANPLHAIFSGAGFVWYGGFIGGFIAVSWAIRRYGLPWLTTVDAMAPGLALAHAIGRLGCQLAGDGDWGRETTLPWGMAYPNAIVGWNYPPGVRVHPTPLYEFAAYTVVFLILWSIRKRPLRAGTLFWLYLVLACGARFAVEFIRINPKIVLGLTQAQLTSLALVAIGAWQLVGSRRRGAPPSRPAERRAA
jgi:phosphatidylglycerol:prolipoprotein diacylglycerol transferase